MMNERISDQVICSEDDVSYSAYDFWYERLSKLGKEEEIEFGVMYIGKDEDGKSWWMFDDRLEKYIAAVDLELNITFEETCESELNFEDTLHSYYHRDWYYLTKSKPMESKYEEVDFRMSYHLVTREEITEITIYTRVEQIRSASIIAIRLRNIGERNNKRYYEIIKGDTCKYIAAKILDKSIYYLETGDTGKMDLKVNLVKYQELGKINITTNIIHDAIEKIRFNL